MTQNYVRDMLKSVVESHDATGTFYSVWNDARDRLGELEYPCVIWGPPTQRITKDANGFPHESILCALIVLGQNPSDRSTDERDLLVSNCGEWAKQILLQVEALYGDDVEVGDIQMSTFFDAKTSIEGGVICSFSVASLGSACANSDDFTAPSGDSCPITLVFKDEDGNVLGTSESLDPCEDHTVTVQWV